MRMMIRAGLGLGLMTMGATVVLAQSMPACVENQLGIIGGSAETGISQNLWDQCFDCKTSAAQRLNSCTALMPSAAATSGNRQLYLPSILAARGVARFHTGNLPGALRDFSEANERNESPLYKQLRSATIAVMDANNNRAIQQNAAAEQAARDKRQAASDAEEKRRADVKADCGPTPELKGGPWLASASYKTEAVRRAQAIPLFEFMCTKMVEYVGDAPNAGGARMARVKVWGYTQELVFEAHEREFPY
jgi:hypothetical protein